MDRRAFLRTAFVGTGLLAGAKVCMAAQSCSPVYRSPFPPFHFFQQCTAGIPSIAFTQAYQYMNEWCWAACISMIFGYYRHPVDQVRIVDETWHSIKNMPAQPSEILHDLNKPWKDDYGMPFRSVGDELSTNAQTAVLDLQSNHPIIVGALGHATVLTALTSTIDITTGQWQVNEAIVRDPWPTNGGRRVLQPNEWYNIQFSARVRVA